MIIGFVMPCFVNCSRGADNVTAPPPAFLGINGGVVQMAVNYTGVLIAEGGFEQISLEVV